MLAFISGILRRILGGLCSKVPVLRKRFFQYCLLFCLYFPVLFICSYHTYLFSLLPHWLFAILGTISLIYAESKGHFPGFLGGTESIEYINEQIAKGRKIPYRKIVTWFGKIRGYEEFGKEWCFWQLLLCKTVCCIFPALFVGYQFIFIGIAVACVYNAAFWVEFKPFKNIMVSPTNWGEFFQGFLYFKGILPF